MIDTSPWSSCSRRSPWLPCSGHRISSTGPSVSPFRDFSSFPAATAALACLHTSWSWLVEQLIVGLSIVGRANKVHFYLLLKMPNLYSTLNIAKSWSTSATEAGKLFREIRNCPPRCWKKNNPRSIDLDLDIDLDIDIGFVNPFAKFVKKNKYERSTINQRVWRSIAANAEVVQFIAFCFRSWKYEEGEEQKYEWI